MSKAEGFDRKKRFLSSQSPNSLPLPPRKHPRLSSPPHSIVVHESSVPSNCDTQEPTVCDHRVLKFHDRAPALEGGRKWDPHYWFFYNNVRQLERGFVLEIPAKDGAMPLTIRYGVPAHGMEELPCTITTERNTLDADSTDTCVSQGNGDARDGYCEMPVNGSCKLDPSYKFFLENLKEEPGGYKLDIAMGEEAAPFVVSYQLSATGFSNGFVPKTSHLGKEKMGIHHVEVPCSLHIMAQENARFDDAADDNATRAIGDVGSHHEEVPHSCRRNNFEVMEIQNTRLDDVEDTHISDGDGLTVNCEIVADSRCLDGIVAETKTQNVVSNETQDVGCHHDEVALSTDRVGSEVMEESLVGINHDEDDVAKCDERHSSEVREVENAWLDQFGDAKYNCTGAESLEAIGDGVTVKCAFVANSRYLDGIVAETETQNVVSNETRDVGCYHEEVTLSTQRVGAEVTKENNVGIDHDGDAVAKCDERHSSEVMEVENTLLDQFGDDKCNCTEAESLVTIETKARLDDEGDDEDTHIGDGDGDGDGDGVTVNCEIVANSRYLDGIIAETETQNVASSETWDVGYYHEEVTLSAERFGSEVMEESNVGIDHNGDAEAKNDERHSSEVMEVENTWLDQFGDNKYNCIEAERLEAIEKKARLDDGGDDEDTHIGDGLTVNCEIVANSRYLDGIVAETETQNVVSNETQDMDCHHEEVTLSTDRVGLEVMEEDKAGIDHHSDAETKCDERHSAEVMGEKNTWLDEVGDAKYSCTEGESLEAVENMNDRSVEDGVGAICVSDCGCAIEVNFGSDFNGHTEGNCVSDPNDQTTNNCVSHGDGAIEVDFISDGISVWNNNAKGNYVSDYGNEVNDNRVFHSNGYGIVAESETKNNCVSHGDGAIEVDFISDGIPVWNNNAKGNYVSDYGNEVNDNRVFHSNDWWIVPKSETQNNCVSHGDGAIEVDFISDGISVWNNNAKGNYVSDYGNEVNGNCVFHSNGCGIVAESEAQKVVSNETLNMGCHHQEVTLSTKSVGSEVMEANNVGIDHYGDAEAKCDEINRSEAMGKKNIWLDQVCAAKYNCTEGESLEAIENMNARSVGNDNGDYRVSDFDRFIEVNFGSDFNGNTEGNRVPDSFHQTMNNCVSHGDGGIEVNFVSEGIADCNNTAKGNCVSDCNDKEKNNCIFHGNGYGEAKDNSVCDDLDGNDNCAPHCDADCDPKGKCSSEVNGGDNEHRVSGCHEDKDPRGSDRDDFEYHCVSDGDDVSEHSASGEDDLRYYSASDAEVEYYCLSDDGDDIDRCVSISGTSKHGLDSDATVDECYKLFLQQLKPDGEIADFPTHSGKTKRANHNGGADSDEEEKPSIDRLNSPFPSFNRRSNTGRPPACARTKLSKFTDKLKFREELMHALKKPYDQSEYEILWDEIFKRRLVNRFKVLRGETKAYPTTRVGKSYIDPYPDLASLIKSAEKDPPRVLNLLRGLSYYLKNMACDEKFFPWKDSACLEILPGT